MSWGVIIIQLYFKDETNALQNFQSAFTMNDQKIIYQEERKERIGKL